MTAIHSTPTVQARIIARTLQLAVAEGMRRDALVEAAGLDGVDLADPEARVPLSLQVALLHLIAKGVSDPGFGVRAGATLDIRETGVLGYIMSYSATLGDALQRLVRYSRVLTEAFELSVAASHDRVAVSLSHAVGAELPFGIDYRLAGVLAACRQITGVQLVPSDVTFTYAQPSTTLEHRRFFQCRLGFGQALSSIAFWRRDLDLPIAKANEALAGYLREYADRVLGSIVSGASLIERVRSAIWNAMGSGRPTLSRIAEDVALPERTLQRRLAEEGTSLHAEIESVRKSMALATLRDERMSVEEVAFILGYTEPSTFFRSFRRWTGMTPHGYRRSAAASAVAPDTSRAARNAMMTQARPGDL